MGGDQCIHNAVIGDLGHAAAVVIKVAGCHAENNGQIPGAVLLPELFPISSKILSGEAYAPKPLIPTVIPLWIRSTASVTEIIFAIETILLLKNE